MNLDFLITQLVLINEAKKVGNSEDWDYSKSTWEHNPIVIGGGTPKTTGKIHGGMLRITNNVHNDEGTGLADPGGVFHPKFPFLRTPIEHPETKKMVPGSPLHFIASGIYRRMPDLSTQKYMRSFGIPLGKKEIERNEQKQEYREQVSDIVGNHLATSKSHGKTLREWGAELPQTPEGHKAFEYHTGNVLDQIKTEVYSKVLDLHRQRGLPKPLRDEEGNVVKDTTGTPVMDPKLKRGWAPAGSAYMDDGIHGRTTPSGPSLINNKTGEPSKKYAPPENLDKLVLPNIDDEPEEPSAKVKVSTNRVNDLIAKTVERVKNHKIN